MDFVHKRQNDVQYLKTVIAQRQIALEQCQRQKSNVQKEVKLLGNKIQVLQTQLNSQKAKYIKQTTNLNMALKEMQHQTQQLRHEKHQLQFQLNVAKMKTQEQAKQNTKEVYRLKNEFQSQKDTLMQKISKLEKNLSTLNNHYHVEQQISSDKHKIIEDANRNLRGFANQKQQRMIIIQNQQFTNEIEYQSRQITSLLQKTQKLQQQIKQYKMDLELHKNIQNDLVKRSSLAQNLIKQLNNRIKQLEMKLQAKQRQIQSSYSVRESKVSDRKSFQSDQKSRISQLQDGQSKKQLQQSLAKLKFENATLKNYNHFLQTAQKNSNKKFQNLGQIMAQHLQILLRKNKTQEQITDSNDILTININDLKNKQIKEWKPQQTQVVLSLLFTQIKHYISKSSLIAFPQAKNIKVSFIEQQNKQPLLLPKIIQEYQKSQNAQMSKKGSRFKDIPVDISTKILRSNLRQWGTKVNFGTNIARNRRQISKSIIVQGEKQII